MEKLTLPSLSKCKSSWIRRKKWVKSCDIMYHESAKKSRLSFWHKLLSLCIRSGFGEIRVTPYGNEDKFLATAYVINVRSIMTSYAKSRKNPCDVYCRRSPNFTWHLLPAPLKAFECVSRSACEADEYNFYRISVSSCLPSRLSRVRISSPAPTTGLASQASS